MAWNWKALGLATGITWGACVLILLLLDVTLGFGSPLIVLLSSLYVGLEPTFLGAIVGTLLAFADGFIGGAVVALLYNTFENL